MNIRKIILTSFILSVFSIPAIATSEAGTAFFSDNDNNQVFKIDIPSMSLINTANTGDKPYPVDLVKRNSIYAITRNENAVTKINICNFNETETIALSHKPRSSSYNAKNKRVLISGADKPKTSIIKARHSNVINVVGSDTYIPPTDFGGGLATGHPYWVSKRRFLQLDRTTRELQLYKRNGNKLDSIILPTSMHHILRAGSDFYAVLEGSPFNGVHPGLLRFSIKGKKIIQTGIVHIDHFDAAIMGSHHASIHPDGTHIYIPSTEGNVFVVDRELMTIVAVAKAGKGAGHVTFVEDRNIAIITNHNDTFVSIIDTNTHQNIQNITVSSLPPSGRKAQSHTASVSPDSNFYYASASHDGIFYELDLNNLNISRSLYLGGYVLQGAFKWGERDLYVKNQLCD